MLTKENYNKLADYLKDVKSNETILSFSEIENIIGASLPNTAYNKRQWWENNPTGHSQTEYGWLLAGWETYDVDMRGLIVPFRKNSIMTKK